MGVFTTRKNMNTADTWVRYERGVRLPSRRTGKYFPPPWKKKAGKMEEEDLINDED